ncbi:MAG TPA: hypothetical protein VGV59_18280 [Pyrinomonadaceae bacterium]|nr:hypothetical protein [Pyrinomonadaceae bacterium]
MHLPLDVAKAARTFETYSSSVNLLSLPFTASSIHLLVYLFHNGQRQFRFLNTPLASKYLRPLIVEAEDGGGVFLSAAEMVEDSRGRRRGEASATTYVTFPDHQLTRADTMWRTQFLDEDYQFSTLEPLLFLRGCGPLLTLGGEATGGRAHLDIIAYPAPPPADGGAESDVSALLKWLGERMSVLFRLAPADVVSWEYVYARSCRTRARNTVMKLKEVEGYIQAWRSTGASLNAETYAWSVKELRELQGALHGSAPRPRATLG